MSRVEFVCPACRQIVLAPPGVEGRAVPCPKCKELIAAWPAPKRRPTPPPLPPLPNPVPKPPPLPTLYPSPDPAASSVPAAFAWLTVAFFTIVALCGSVAITICGEELHKEAETELQKAEQYRGSGYGLWGDRNFNLELTKARLESALEQDRRDRRTAIANIALATLFEVFVFSAIGVFLTRPDSRHKRVILHGCLAGGLLGLVGLMSSQFAPMFGGYLVRLSSVPFSPRQLTILSEHVLIFGVVGMLLVGGTATIRSESRD